MPAFVTLKGTKAKIPYKKLLKAKPKRSEDVEWEGNGSDSLMIYAKYKKNRLTQFLNRFIDIPDERSFRFNPLGAIVWELCDGTHSVEDIKGIIMKRSKGDEKEIEKRLIKFLNRLSANDLITLEV
ncbi:MAG TPA: PqqD family protein [Methanocella sp.]|uniref:PqqD family protein n=1 Tax=Methanocella sp. TaxID=2052833 RepID=UPI002B564FB6|nr:PqqD family protein [Methanocella sp.]HTY90346.1 PqqD family protein [Methanocella sp.]